MHDIRSLASWLREAFSATVFTGAGSSTESGLPDFRSNGGLWKNRHFTEVASIESFHTRFPEYVEFYRWRIESVLAHQPHEGHRVLTRLQQRGLLKGVITQNVDGYHQAAGSTGVLELHGSLRTQRCQTCGDTRSSVEFLTPDGIHCACGGNYRPNIVMFGERLNAETWEAAEALAAQSDLIIVLGSSLTVSPANMLPEATLANGGKLVIINHDRTPLDEAAALVLRSPIGETLVALEAALGGG